MQTYFLLAAISLLIPGFYVLAAAHNRFGRAVILWLTWPIIVYSVMIIWELMTRAPVASPIGSALLGFSLISAILIVPWLLISAVFLGLAFLLRRVFHQPKAPIAGAIEVRSDPSALLHAPAANGPDAAEPVANLDRGVVEGHRHTSPDGTICVELEPVEWSNTHWVKPPRVTDHVTGDVILDLWQSDWDAAVGFPGARQVILNCRRYHVGGGLTVLIDIARNTYQITETQNVAGSLPAAPLEQILHGMEEASRCSAAAGPQHPAPDIRLAANAIGWQSVLVILGGLVFLIGIITVGAMHAEPTAGSPEELFAVPEGGFRPADE